jgi:hypothetical protein
MQTARFFGSVHSTSRYDGDSDELADGIVSIKMTARPAHGY